MRSCVKTPTVYQMEAAECGAASLAMVLAYFGKELPLEQLRIETGVSRDGSNAANLMRCARAHGLECHGYRKEPEALAKLEPPCIIHWNFDHFVVFEGFKGQYAFLNDPAVGRRRITVRELDEGFTGVVLTFKPTETFQKERRTHSAARAVRDKLRGEHAALFQLLWIGLLLVVPGLALPALSRIFLDDILMAGLTDWLPRLLAFMAALLLLRSGLSFYRSMLLQRLRSKLTLVSGYGFLRHLLRLPVSFFDQVLSLDAKNARAYYGMALAKAQCRDADVYINMLCSGTPRAENIELPRDEKHIREAAEKYAVPGYLNAEEIRALYDYKPSYHGPVVATGAGGADRCRVSNWKLFVNLGTLEIERREASKRISDERRESEERYKAEQAKIIKDLEREKAQIQDELSDLQGLFTSKRRRALESRLAEIVTKPDRPSGRTRQRRAGQGLRLGENTLCQSLNTPCRPQPDV